MKRRAGANRGKGGCCNRISLEKERYYERGERKGGAMRGTGTSTSQHSNNIHINRFNRFNRFNFLRNAPFLYMFYNVEDTQVDEALLPL